MGGVGSSISGFAWFCISVAALFNESTRWFGILMLGSCALFIIGIFTWAMMSARSQDKAFEEQSAQQKIMLTSAMRKVDDLITKHQDTLANQRDVLFRIDRYGIVDDNAWWKEKDRFITRVIRPSLTDGEGSALSVSEAEYHCDQMDKFEADNQHSSSFNLLEDMIEDRVALHCKTRPVADKVAEGMTPIEFEGACAAVLRSLGWNASATQGSGDQGADVIATKDGRRLVIQCKLYTGVVGNKSIQEVIAARIFYKADLAVVVCNSAFTKSATTQRDVLFRIDRYGIVDDNAWWKEKDRFITRVIRPSLTDGEGSALSVSEAEYHCDQMDKFEADNQHSSSFNLLEDMIEDRVALHCKTRPVADKVAEGMTPIEFEGACAAVLRSLGWNASATQGSGDQGADVIATKDGRRLVIQCKLYTGVVGNKSIQEVIAARIFYKADLAVVVCNSAFTKSATTLATASGVETLLFGELRRWASSLNSEPIAKAG